MHVPMITLQQVHHVASHPCCRPPNTAPAQCLRISPWTPGLRPVRPADAPGALRSQAGCRGAAAQLRASATPRGDGEGGEQQEAAEGGRDAAGEPAAAADAGAEADASLPAFAEGVNTYCYWALGLLFIADFTPIGAAVRQSQDGGAWLAALQWGCFVAPTAAWSAQRGFDLGRTFGLRACAPGWVLAGAAAGPAVLSVTAALVALKASAGGDAAGALDGAGLPAASALFASQGGDWGRLAALAALSPAAAEELLFRGFLLGALRQRLGAVDSVALCGALFAAIHLSVEQFFGLAVLGFACGGVSAAAGGSVWPAVALHASYNLAALLAATGGGGYF